MGDVVLEVNGQNVAEEHLEDVIALMKGGGQTVSLRVNGPAGGPKRPEETPPAAKAEHGPQNITIPLNGELLTPDLLSVSQQAEEKQQITCL